MRHGLLFFLLGILAAPVYGADTMDLDHIHRMLQWREQKLQNCKIAASESVYQSSDGNPEKLLSTTRYTLKWRDQTYHFEVEEIDISTNNARNKSILSWDGQKYRSIFAREGETTCRINPDDRLVLSASALHHIYGIRHMASLAKVDGKTKTVARKLSEWFQDARESSSLVATADEKDPNRIIVKANWGKAINYLWELDASKNYMPIRCVVKWDPGVMEVREDEGTVTRMIQQDGMWVPVEAVGKAIRKGPKENVITRTVTSVDSIELKRPSPEDMEVTFPPGAFVMDSTLKEAYILKANGEKEMQPHYDPRTGKVYHEAPTTKPAESAKKVIPVKSP